MRALIWTFRLLIFLVLFAFAAKNTEPVTLRFFFGLHWQTPIIVLVLAAFALGALFGVLAMTPSWIRQWRAKRRLSEKIASPAERSPRQPPEAGA